MIVQDFTPPAIGECVYLAGADASLVGVDPETYNIIPSAIEDASTPQGMFRSYLVGRQSD